MSERIRLHEDDLKVMAPGKIVSLGYNQVVIKPLGIELFLLLMGQVEGIKEEIRASGVTLGNWRDQLPALQGLLLGHGLGMLEIMTNIHQEDLRCLPVGKLMELLAVALEVNVQHNLGLLEKNLAALAEMARTLLPGLLDTSSHEDTDSTTSNATP